jgi:hypothetical protein
MSKTPTSAVSWIWNPLRFRICDPPFGMTEPETRNEGNNERCAGAVLLALSKLIRTIAVVQ